MYILGETRLVLCGRKWTVEKETVLSHCVTDWTFLANNWKKENAGFHSSFSISFFYIFFHKKMLEKENAGFLSSSSLFSIKIVWVVF